MNTYVVLLRGINVGGKNKVPMAALKECLEKIGFSNVTTYIASGNVVIDSHLSAADAKTVIEREMPRYFDLHNALIKVLLLTRAELSAVIDGKPAGFGEQPNVYYSDVIFLMNIDIGDALKVFSPREGVDAIWAGTGVIYSRRLGELRTKSRLNKIVGTTPYQSMTIRTWGTVTKLLEILDKRASSEQHA